MLIFRVCQRLQAIFFSIHVVCLALMFFTLHLCVWDKWGTAQSLVLSQLNNFVWQEKKHLYKPKFALERTFLVEMFKVITSSVEVCFTFKQIRQEFLYQMYLFKFTCVCHVTTLDKNHSMLVCGKNNFQACHKWIQKYIVLYCTYQSSSSIQRYVKTLGLQRLTNKLTLNCLLDVLQFL